MNALLPIGSLLLSVSLLLMAHGLMGTLLPLRGMFEGYSSAQLGILGAVFFLGFGIGTVLGPRAINRVGHIRTFTAMAALICISVTLQALVTNPVSWWIARALTGLCLAILFIVIESWLNANSTNENRGMIFSVYTVITLAVMTMGQALTTVSDVANFTLFAFAIMLFAASAVPVSLTRTTAPTPAGTAKLRMRYLYSLSPVAVVGAMAVGWANGAFWTLGPVFAQRETGDVTMVAAFMGATVISGAVGQLPLGWLSDRCDRRLVIIMASLCASIAAIGHVVTTLMFNLTGILACAAAFGFFALPLYALCAAHLNDQVEEDEYVEASSGLLLLYASGAVVGPLLASALMDRFGPQTLFVFTGVVHFALVLFAVVRLKFRKTTATADRMSFSDTLVATSTVANLDPATSDSQ